MGILVPIFIWASITIGEMRRTTAALAVGCALIFGGTLLDNEVLFFIGGGICALALRNLARHSKL
jgi:hypothetical protein